MGRVKDLGFKDLAFKGLGFGGYGLEGLRNIPHGTTSDDSSLSNLVSIYESFLGKGVVGSQIFRRSGPLDRSQMLLVDLNE